MLDPFGSRCKVGLQALRLMHDDGGLTRTGCFLAIAESGMSSSLSLISPLDQPLQSLGPALGGPPSVTVPLAAKLGLFELAGLEQSRGGPAAEREGGWRGAGGESAAMATSPPRRSGSTRAASPAPFDACPGTRSQWGGLPYPPCRRRPQQSRARHTRRCAPSAAGFRYTSIRSLR